MKVFLLGKPDLFIPTLTIFPYILDVALHHKRKTEYSFLNHQLKEKLRNSSILTSHELALVIYLK